MPEFEIIWAPLSRKWQVWQRQLDDSGCAVETLIGEYTSEGRANHEAGILRGDIPADTEYEAPHRRRWFSLRRPKTIVHTPGDASTIDESILEPAQHSAGNHVESKDRPVVDPTQSSNLEQWRSDLSIKLEQAQRSAEQDEVEAIRQMLEEALLAVPSAENQQAA